MRTHHRTTLLVFGWLVLIPSLTYGQGTITGVVRDTSGAVLPGVTVEAASPALIEKVRAAVTDGTGQYRIVDLRPGTYEVTFALPGFNTARREGVQLSGEFVATVNAELRVGALEETLVVTGETPVVDVQSTTRQRVLTDDIVNAIPVNRVPAFMAALVPGVTSSSIDVGGTQGTPTGGTALTAHGSRATDLRTMQNGLSVQTLERGSSVQGVPNMLAFQEVAIDTGAVDATQTMGGIRINLIPREGGNSFSGTFIAAFANEDLARSNYTQELQDRGLQTPGSVHKIYDLNPGIGGPIRRDRLWFFGTARYTAAYNYVPIFYNRNAGNPAAWTYEPDRGRPVDDGNRLRNVNARLTWQANSENKFGLSIDRAKQCNCGSDSNVGGANATIAPESGSATNYDPKGGLALDWSSPVTSRLLLDAAFYRQIEHGSRSPMRPDQLNAVTDQATGLTFRANAAPLENIRNTATAFRASISYITGAHALKAGVSNQFGARAADFYSRDAAVAFRFNNGVPNQLTMYATPYPSRARLDGDLGAYVQDRWTISRWTLSLGVRYDHFRTSYPEVRIGSGLYTPGRDLLLPETEGLNWKDVTPKTGLSYDVFGTGKTALKVTLNKYVAGQALRGNENSGTTIFGLNLQPSNRLATSTTRSWNDANRNFVPDCDLLRPAANGECGAMSDANFGQLRPATTYDPETLGGWGNRFYNWEFSAGVQHELVQRVSLDVSFFRRWYGNFVVTDNRAVAASDYSPFSITAPANPLLPDGGGYVVSGLYDLNPSKVGQVDNYITFADNYGTQRENWTGVDVTVNARPRDGVLLLGGLSTGRTLVDVCDVFEALPEMQFGIPTLAITNNNAATQQSRDYCVMRSKFLTSLKLLGTYTIPKVDVQVSGNVQNLPGPQLAANYPAPNAVVAPSLGRSLSGNAANATVNLVAPGTRYGERLNTVDFRIGKVLRLGGFRTTVSADVYNVLNANAVLSESVAFATLGRPQSILTASFVKLGLQLEF
jgi:hypothetical protein